MEYKIFNKESEAVISSTGGTILNFKVNGKNIFYPYYLTTNGKARGGCPICAPWFGSTRFAEKKHGYLRNVEAYKVIEKEENSIILLFQHNGTEKYPWKLHYQLEFFLENQTLKTLLNIRRLYDGVSGFAPVNPGFHPYFYGKADQVSVRTGEKFYINFSNDSRQVSLESNSVLISTSDKEVLMKLGGEFSSYVSRLVLWTDAIDKYVCVEPILLSKELFNSSAGLSLNSGESIKLSMELTV